MKIRHIANICAWSLGLAAFAGCNNADYSSIDNRIYISEAAPADKFNQQTETITVTGETTTTLHVRLAKSVSHDVVVRLALDEALVDTYNSVNGTNYSSLPDEYVEYDSQVTILAGTLSSDAVTIKIKKFPTDDGKAYAVPMKIAETNSSVAVTQSTSKLIYLLSTPLQQFVPTMDRRVKPKGAGDWNVSTDAWTLEGWIWMDSFDKANQAIMSGVVSEGTEIYIRFGDADVDFNKLQIKTGGSQFNSNKVFELSTWYHIAFVYGNGKCTLYINGQEDNSLQLSTHYVINNLLLCSSGSSFVANAKMAQIRFWSKALAQSAIKDAMNRVVPADSEGLFGYWKMDEGEGSVYKDATSNGFDLTCGVAPIWSTEKVDFSKPNE